VKICYFNDYRLGVVKGDQVVDITDAVKDIPHLHNRDLIIGLTAYVADTEAEAYEKACPLLAEYQKMFAPLGFVRPITPEQVDMVADPARAAKAGLQTPREQGWVLGPPEQMVRRLLELEEQLPGLEEVMIGQPVGTPRHILLEQLELVGKEVIPAFREQQAKKAQKAH